jgi:hypothetical protein
MDPLQVITAAVASGAAAAAQTTAAEAIKDSYAALKSLVLEKFGKKGDAAEAVKGVETKPTSKPRQEVLREELESAGAGKDQEVVDKATELLKLLESHTPGATGGLVGQINAAGGKVVVIGGDVHGGFKM